MNKYVFYDSWWDGMNDYSYDITGDDYKKMIETCCKYSTVVSFIFFKKHSNINLAKELEPYRIDCPDNITYTFSHYVRDLIKNEEIRYYRVCPELCYLLTHCVGGIFEWIQGWGLNNPEEPTFYREDGSVFFTSTIHEGELYLTPRDDEDVSKIISIDGWRKPRSL